MRKNLLKEKLDKGLPVTSVLMQDPSMQALEILGIVGFDWVLIDCEHSAMSIETVAKLVLVAELRGIVPFVRVGENELETVLRYLAVGVMGIVVPGLSSPEDVKKAVAVVKYPPEGQRGLAPTRVADFGLVQPLPQYVRMANEETMIFGLLESREGVDRADEILGTKGLDGVLVGVHDLSNAYGVSGQIDHPLVEEAIEKVLQAGKRIGKPIGAGVYKGTTPKTLIDRGFRMVGAHVNGLITTAGKEFIESAHS
jgi:4-hydroxy-2-oxoheptanedioate aldolase